MIDRTSRPRQPARLSRILRTGAMVGMAGQDRQSPIDLFDDERPHDLVGYGQRTEGQDEFRPVPDALVETVGATNDAGEARTAGIAPGGDPLREGFARDRPAALVEGDKRKGAGSRQKLVGFLATPLLLAARPALGPFDEIGPGETEAAAKALGALPVALDELALRPALQTADGKNGKPHGR
jgi:hypothetical protein